MAEADGWVTVDLSDDNVKDELEDESNEIEDTDNVSDDEDSSEIETEDDSGQVDDEDGEDDSADEGQVDGASAGGDVQPERASKDKKRKSRAQERIQQLVQKNKETEQKYLELQAQNVSLQSSSAENKKSSLESQKNLIDSRVADVRLSLKRAIEDENIESQLELQEKLSDLKVDQRIIDSQVTNAEKEVSTHASEQAPAQEQGQSQIPEEMRYYLEDNAWVLNPSNREERKKVQALRKISNELIEDGYSEADIEFYDELDSRLEKSLGKSGTDGVQYKNKDTKPSSPDVKERTKQSPVSGSSRAPTGKRGKVVLSPEEKAMAKRLNISDSRYKERKKAIGTKNENGWTTIV